MKEYSSIQEGKSAPKLFAWLASVMLITLIIASQLLPRGHFRNFRFVGVVILLIAPVFIFLPFLLLSNHGKNEEGNCYMNTRRVIDEGLFAFLRHPQYLGYMMLAVGFSFLAQNLVVLFLAIISIICFYIQALKEEKYCLDKFGKSYKDYLHRVPRFNIFSGVWKKIRGNKHD